MKKLLIHNNNTSLNTEELFSINEQFVFDVDFDKSLDMYINEKLNGELGDLLKQSDIVYIKVALSDNYLEYLGLRLIYHIRLTESLGDKKYIPIVLITDESLQFLGLTAKEPSILFTKGIYLMNDSYSSFQKFEENFKKGILKPLEDFDNFIDSIRIKPPANYDSHHSIANEWALVRYFSMLKNDSQNERYHFLKNKIIELDYIKTLHFKYIESQSQRQKFNKKHFYTPAIDKVNGKRIGVIDDELDKGWFEFYDYIFEMSGVKIDAFDNYSKDEIKEALIERIKLWFDAKMDSDNPIDIFIVDIRLHDEDFFETDFDNLTGIKIIDYIKRKNPGVQIVVHTASNKVWNYQKALQYGVNSFCIKESPENFNSRMETKYTLDYFCKQIEKANNKSFLAQLFRRIENLKHNHIFIGDSSKDDFCQSVFSRNGLLDQIFNLLILDEEEAIINQCLLLCFQIIERYCNTVGDFERSSSTLNSGSVWTRDKLKKRIFITNTQTQKISTHFDLVFGQFSFQDVGSRDTPISFNLFDKMELKSKFQSGIDSTTLVEIISVLHFRDNISKHNIENLMRLRYFRSNVAAHYTGNIKSNYKIDSADILFFFDIYENTFLWCEK